MRETITEEITKVQEIKIPQKIFQSIGLKDAMSEDTFMAGIMCATFLGGGKPSQGERFRYYKPYHQQRQ